MIEFRDAVVMINGQRLEGVTHVSYGEKRPPAPERPPTSWSASGEMVLTSASMAELQAMVRRLFAPPTRRYWQRRALYKRRSWWRFVVRAVRRPGLRWSYQEARHYCRTGNLPHALKGAARGRLR